MNENYPAIRQHMESLFDSMSQLKRLGVLNNKKDFTSQIGEWFVAELYDCIFADSNIQKGWDLRLLTGQRVQVKTHAKASTNPNKWTALKYEENAPIDILVIVVFTEDYKLKKLYKIPWNKAFVLSQKDNAGKRFIKWNRLDEFSIDFNNLSKKAVLELFI